MQTRDHVAQEREAVSADSLRVPSSGNSAAVPTIKCPEILLNTDNEYPSH